MGVYGSGGRRVPTTSAGLVEVGAPSWSTRRCASGPGPAPARPSVGHGEHGDPGRGRPPSSRRHIAGLSVAQAVLDGRCDRRPRCARGAALALEQDAVLVDVAAVARGLGPEVVEASAAAVRAAARGARARGRPGTGRSERSSSRWASSAVVAADQVGGHVVGGAERASGVGSCRLAASAATSSKVTNGDHSTTACPWSSMPRRPARPVSWVYWPGVRDSWRSPVNLVSFSITTVRAGMLMPRARVSVAKTTFTSPSTKHASTASLNGGTMPAWWAAMPGLERGEPAVVAEHGQVVVGEVAPRGARRSARIRARSSASVRRSPASMHAGDGVVAAGPAEDEEDGRAAARCSARCSTTSTRRGVAQRRRGRRARRAACHVARGIGVEAVASGLGRPSTQGRAACAISLGLVVHQVPVVERHRAASCSTTTAVGPRTVLDPVGQLVGVGHRGRQAHEAHSAGRWTMTSSHTGPR